MSDVSTKCNELIFTYKQYGPEAAKRELRVQLESIAENAHRLLAERGFVRITPLRIEIGFISVDNVGPVSPNASLTEIDLPKRDLRQLLRDGADDTRQYLGTFAGLFRRSEYDDSVPDTSARLAHRCMEVLYFHLLCREAVTGSGDETIFRAWLGILITS